MSSPAASELVDAMVAAYQTGKMEQVIALGMQAGVPAEEPVAVLLGLAWQASARFSEAVAAFRELTRLHPAVSAYWNNLGVACRQLGDLPASEEALLTARSLQPDDAEVHYNLGLLYLQQHRWSDAREALLDAVEQAPDFIDARLQAARACYVCGDSNGQQSMLAKVGQWPPQPAQQALMLSAMLAVQGDTDTALHVLALAQLPAPPETEIMRQRVAAKRSALLERSNQLQAAREALQSLPLRAIDALPPSVQQLRAEAWSAHAALCMREGHYADAAELYRRALALDLDDEARAGAAFGLAGACDKLGHREQAWQALQTAHAAQLETAREVVPQLLTPDSLPLQMTEHRVGRDAYAGWAPMESPTDVDSPVFVLGFPRSGTTLLEQMLDAHPGFRSMDERAFIHELTERMNAVGQRYPDDLGSLTASEVGQLRAVYFQRVHEVLPRLGSRCLVDKNPLNMLCLPMIMRLFPNARIILCLRHPCDVLLSCYMQTFRSPAFMVLCSSLQRLAEGYVRAFDQWQQHAAVFAPRVLEWRYESVVSHFGPSVAELGKFLGVEDASPMAEFPRHARNKRFISTPSYAQVTQGISSKSVDHWRAYRTLFEPVLPTLRQVIHRLGYTE